MVGEKQDKKEMPKNEGKLEVDKCFPGSSKG